MPLKRASSHIPINFTVAQLLSMLQLQGVLDGVEAADWAVGTSVEELLEAVQRVGDGEWLTAAYPNHGAPEAADAWIQAFMEGKEVVANKKEAAAAQAKAEMDLMLREFIAQAPAADRKAIQARMKKSAAFKDEAGEHIMNVSRLVAGMCVIPDPEYAKQKLDKEIAKGARATDKAFATLTRFYLGQLRDFFDQMDETVPWEKALKRAQAIEKALSKAEKAAAKA